MREKQKLDYDYPPERRPSDHELLEQIALNTQGLREAAQTFHNLIIAGGLVFFAWLAFQLYKSWSGNP